MSYTFKSHLNQVQHNLHLEHAEEQILVAGKVGAKKVDDMLRDIIDQLSGHVTKKYNLTAKWDGSPAIVVGVNPENHKFFVGTNSVFNKTPKIAYTPEDVNRWYGDKPDLARLLICALEYLPALGMSGVYQGDVMFGPSRETTTQTIDGKRYVTFTPNTITYAIEHDTKLAKQISQAKIGVVFHTKYVGTKINNLHATFDINAAHFKTSKHVWFDDASYKDMSGTLSFMKSETTKIKRHLQLADKALTAIDSSDLNDLTNDKKMTSYIKMYVNSRIRNGEHFGNINTFCKRLEQFIHLRIDGESVSDSTKHRKKQSTSDTLKSRHATIKKVIEWQDHINEIKLMIVHKLNSMKSVETFLDAGKGFKLTDPEGYVCVDHLTNTAVKLVNRLEFSKANFNKHT